MGWLEGLASTAAEVSGRRVWPVDLVFALTASAASLWAKIVTKSVILASSWLLSNASAIASFSLGSRPGEFTIISLAFAKGSSGVGPVDAESAAG